MAPEPLVLKGNCDGCGVTTDLYGSTCKHMTICIPCGKSLVETSGTCTECGIAITRLIREYNVKHHVPSKQYFVGRFHQGIPHFSKKKTSETKWTMQRDGAQGRQLTDAQRDKMKLKPWILEDDKGQQQFTGQLEGGQQATYFLLIMQGNDFMALPAGSWYNFHKVAQYKQLTLEEAEEQMKNRRKTADGYQRWMMKAANTGAAAFGGVGEEKIGGSGGGGGRRKSGEDDEDAAGADSDKAEEDEDEEEARKKRLGMKNAGGGDEDGEEPALDLDLDDEEPEKGDDWEHEENFTDDDEAVGNDADERDDQVNPEIPPPPEIKQEEEDEEEGQEGQEDESGGLSKSGKELKKLLGKAAKEDDSDGEEDEEDGDEDVDLDNEDIGLSPVLAPTRKDGPKDEPAESTPAKAAPASKTTPTSASGGKGKRKAGTQEEPKVNGTAAAKKTKTETAKASPQSTASKKDVNAAVKAATAPSNTKVTAAAAKPAPPANQAVTEDEVMRVLKATGPIKSTDLVAKFRSRLRTPEDKSAFAAILKKISRIQKTDGANYIVLRQQ